MAKKTFPQDWWTSILGCFNPLIKVIGSLKKDYLKSLCVLTVCATLLLVAIVIGVFYNATKGDGVQPFHFFLIVMCIIVNYFVFNGALRILTVLRLEDIKESEDRRSSDSGRRNASPSSSTSSLREEEEVRPTLLDRRRGRESLGLRPAHDGGDQPSNLEVSKTPVVVQDLPPSDTEEGNRVRESSPSPGERRVVKNKAKLETLAELVQGRMKPGKKLSQHVLKELVLGFISLIIDDIENIPTLEAATEKLLSIRMQVKDEIKFRSSEGILGEKLIEALRECIALFDHPKTEFQ